MTLPFSVRFCLVRLGLGIMGVLLCLVSGCSAPQSTVSASPSTTPLSQATADATVSPALSPMPQSGDIERRFFELIKAYEAPVTAQDNGWTLMKPLLGKDLSSTTGASLSERIDGLDLSRKADLAFFDERVLPVVRQAFVRKNFLGPHKLLLGQDPLNPHYRTLRRICELVGERAGILFKQGKSKEALALIELPLSLNEAMERRPETVSIGLFSLSFAQAGLRPLNAWLKTGAPTPAQLAPVGQLLKRLRPNLAHLQQMVAVDFAQLDHSLATETIRSQVLGLGMSSPADIATWRAEVVELLPITQALIDPRAPGATDPVRAFNLAVVKLSTPVQGLILEYPAMLASVRFGYASYLATEVAVELKRQQVKGVAVAQKSDNAVSVLFQDSPEALAAAKELMLITPDVDGDGFVILGQAKPFKAISPESPPMLYGQEL